MRKWLSKTIACVLACASLLSVASCAMPGMGNQGNGGNNASSSANGGGNANSSANGGNANSNSGPSIEDILGGGGNSGETEKVVDNTKTQLYVQNYTAGFGDEWLYDLEARFEEANKDTVYEDGKQGIQVWHQGAMKDYTGQDILAGTQEVYFMEGAEYYALTSVEGALENLTDIVINPNTDGKTIFSKMTKQQKDYFGITGTDGDPKYYAIPHYEGGWGLIYNKGLFDEKGYYFDESGDLIYENKSAKRGTGPDGKSGTDDDGLPRTYEEFYTLCEEIRINGDMPICWSGEYREQYLTVFLNTLVAEYEGAEQMELNLTFEGTAEDLVVFDEAGKVVYEDGEIKTERLDITTANGAELTRQAGKLYALEFLHKIMTTDGWVNQKNAFNGTHSHLDAQEDFLKGGTKVSSDKAYAMLVDGPWWEAEATNVFTLMSIQDAQYSKKNRNYAWMPLPKATEAKVGTESIYIDTLDALCCVKAGLGPKKQAALDFVKFAVTDESLVKFTQITGAYKAFDYSLTEEQQEVLSPFAKSMHKYRETATTFVMNSGNAFYQSNINSLQIALYYHTKGYSNPVAAFNNDSETPKGFFEGMYSYWKSSAIWQ